MTSMIDVEDFDIQVLPDRDRVVLAIAGEVDLAVVPALREVVAELREAGWSDVVLDVRRITFLDSSGLHWLLSVDEDARANGWSLSLVHGSAAVDRLLEMTGLQDRFQVAQRR